ncbi:hypothetical protein GCM10027168_00930 [Streptomyces capparidis]|jgi:hypothetical protein
MPDDSRPRPDDKRSKAEQEADRRRRRALFLRELNEARELRARVQPRRVRAARMRQALRMRTFRW